MEKLKSWLKKPWNAYLLDNFNFAYQKIIKDLELVAEKYKKDFYKHDAENEFGNLVYEPFYKYFTSRHPDWNVSFQNFVNTAKSEVKKDFEEYEMFYRNSNYLLDPDNLKINPLTETQLSENLFSYNTYVKIDKHETKNYKLLMDDDFENFQEEVAKLLGYIIHKMAKQCAKENENEVEKMIHAVQSINFFDQNFLSIYLNDAKLKKLKESKLSFFDALGITIGSIKG